MVVEATHDTLTVAAPLGARNARDVGDATAVHAVRRVHLRVVWVSSQVRGGVRRGDGPRVGEAGEVVGHPEKG